MSAGSTARHRRRHDGVHVVESLLSSGGSLKSSRRHDGWLTGEEDVVRSGRCERVEDGVGRRSRGGGGGCVVIVKQVGENGIDIRGAVVRSGVGLRLGVGLGVGLGGCGDGCSDIPVKR